MATCFGVHLGNTSICLALSRDGKTEVIANDSGDRVTPATATFNGSELEVCIHSKGGSRRKAVITNNKKLFNVNLNDDLEALNNNINYKIIPYEKTLNYEVQVEDDIITVTPDQIATKFYGKMFSIATHAACTEEELQSVIAVPLYWSKESRQRVITAAELAGFNVLQMISEPAAALLAYDLDESPQEEIVLVYRIGGSSCDASIVKVTGGIFSIESTTHQSGIGGQYITQALANYIASEFFQKWKLDPQENKRAMDKLFHYANDCKHVLSTLNSSHVFIESLYEGTDWSQHVSRARFESLLSSNIEACISPVRKLLDESEHKSNINKVILCGGSMKIPKLQTAISDLLPDAVILNSLSPDEAISQGCAKQAALLLENADICLEDTDTSIDCILKPIFAKYLDQKVCLFPAGSPIYSEIKLPITLTGKTDKIDVNIFEDNENNTLHECKLNITSNKPQLHVILHNNELIVDAI